MYSEFYFKKKLKIYIAVFVKENLRINKLFYTKKKCKARFNTTNKKKTTVLIEFVYKIKIGKNVCH